MGGSIEYLTKNEINALLNEIRECRDLAIVTLLLNTGIFLSELVNLKTDSINWKGRMLAVSGNRKRDIPLNDQAHEALAKWSQERIDNQSSALFITNKGPARELSARSVEHIIHKYVEEAGIKRRANAQILRNTFAVRFFSEETSKEKAAMILGISDQESINRYAQAAKQPPKANLTPEDLAVVDSRSFLRKLTSKLLPTHPKVAKPINNIKGPITPCPEEVVFGRDSVKADIKSNLTKGQSVLLFGPLGVGKTHLLKHINKLLGPNIIYITTPTPIKNMLTQICERLDPKYKEQLNARASAKDMVDYIIRHRTSDLGHRTLLIIDNLNNLKGSDADTFIALLEHFTVLASTEEITHKHQQIWWKFKQIELKPLKEESSKQLIKYLTQNLAVSDYEFLETRTLNLSGGLPLVIVDMIHQVSHKHVVNREVIREVYHEAGTHYRDWTNTIMLLWGLTVMFRFVALGTHSFEGYILAGFGTAFITMMRFFAYRMR